MHLNLKIDSGKLQVQPDILGIKTQYVEKHGWHPEKIGLTSPDVRNSCYLYYYSARLGSFKDCVAVRIRRTSVAGPFQRTVCPHIVFPLFSSAQSHDYRLSHFFLNSKQKNGSNSVVLFSNSGREVIGCVFSVELYGKSYIRTKLTTVPCPSVPP